MLRIVLSVDYTLYARHSCLLYSLTDEAIDGGVNSGSPLTCCFCFGTRCIL